MKIKVFVAPHVTIILLGSFTTTVYGEVDAESLATKSQIPPAVVSPKPAPSPKLPLRSPFAVQGVVYCKSCKYIGIDTLLGALPLSGAVVKLQCSSGKNPITVETKTDKNGYFFLQAPKKVTTSGVHKYKMFRISSPLNTCKKPTDLHLGLSGAILRLEKPPSTTVPYAVYTVGLFAFDVTDTSKCPR